MIAEDLENKLDARIDELNEVLEGIYATYPLIEKPDAMDVEAPEHESPSDRAYRVLVATEYLDEMIEALDRDVLTQARCAVADLFLAEVRFREY